MSSYADVKNPQHGRDHEHGGSDPVRIAWEDVEGGGGGGGASGPSLFAASGFTTINFTTNVDWTTALPFDSGSFATNDPATFSVNDTTDVVEVARDGYYQFWSMVYAGPLNAYGAGWLATALRLNKAGGGVYNPLNGSSDDIPVSSVIFTTDALPDVISMPPRTGSQVVCFNLDGVASFPAKLHLYVFGEFASPPSSRSVQWSVTGMRFDQIPDPDGLISN